MYMYRLPWWLIGKEPACKAGDRGLIPGLGRSPGGRHGNPPTVAHQAPLSKENFMDRGAWWVTVQGSQSWT